MPWLNITRRASPVTSLMQITGASVQKVVFPRSTPVQDVHQPLLGAAVGEVRDFLAQPSGSAREVDQSVGQVGVRAHG
jgi:hypothetical protein